MNKGNNSFLFAFISILIVLAIGYALYAYPKNYEVLEIDAKNDNYSIVGIFIGGIAFTLAILSILLFKGTKRRILLSVELILSIILLFLWKKW